MEMEEEVNLREYIEVIYKKRILILAITITVALLVGLPSLSKKDIYEAKAALILKENSTTIQNPFAGMQNLFGMKSNNGANFPILLQSRAVAAEVLDNLQLAKRIKGWDAPGVKRQNLITAVQSMVKFSVSNKEGFFEIKATTDDPSLSADIANAFAVAGEEYWNKMSYTEARKKREYIENQLPRVDADLKRAETSLKKFALISPQAFSLTGVEFKRLQREYEIQDTIYTMLRKEYESAKIDESKEVEPFAMIDPAEKLLSPIKPKVFLSFMTGIMMGLIGGVLLAFVSEYWEKTGVRNYK